MKSKIDKVYKNAKKVIIDDSSKIVIMSDCHRGTGDNFDNFIKNKNIYEAALRRYYLRGFTYIELGDGDDMWEVKDYKEIVHEHLSTFKLLKKFHDDKRLVMIYGNHDICKRNNAILKENFYTYYDNIAKKEKVLLKDLEVYEAVVLNYRHHDLFLIHGHQVDLLNSTFWRLSRFLVRYLWRPLENIGFKDPTSAGKNYRGGKFTDKKLESWSLDNQKILIAGHTHKAVYPSDANSLYFNDGSCIHPNGITCLEIENGKITLVKWTLKVTNNNLISVGRNVLDGGDSITDFFK